MSTSSATATAKASTDSKSVYILALEAGKYYVGATSDLNRRIRSHRQGNGAKWTQRYSVIEIAAASHDVMDWKAVEKEVTLRMMAKYGWENVRGGPWTQTDLSAPPTALE